MEKREPTKKQPVIFIFMGFLLSFFLISAFPWSFFYRLGLVRSWIFVMIKLCTDQALSVHVALYLPQRTMTEVGFTLELHHM